MLEVINESSSSLRIMLFLQITKPCLTKDIKEVKVLHQESKMIVVRNRNRRLLNTKTCRAQRDGGNETDLDFQTLDSGVDNGPELDIHLPMMGTLSSSTSSLLSSDDDDGDLMVTDLAMSDENPDLGVEIHVDRGDLPIQETEEGRILSLQSAEFGVNGQIMVYDPGAHLALVTSIDATSANAEL